MNGASTHAPMQEYQAMRTRSDMQSIAPFIFEYFFNGLRSRMAPGLLLPHPSPQREPRVRRRSATIPSWRIRARDHQRAGLPVARIKR